MKKKLKKIPWILLLLSSIWREIQMKVLPGTGTFKMNGIFPITSRDHINYQSGVMMAEAMRYAVHTIDQDYLHGYTLEIQDIFDTEDDDVVRKCILDTFTDKVPILIGPYSSETSYIGSILTRTFGQLAVSYSATYSDFDKTQEYMVRSVLTDRFRVEAALDVVRKLNWNYIGVISSYGYNGEREALRFIQKLPDIDVCLANQIDLPQQGVEEEYVNAISTMNIDVRLKALVLFTTNTDSRMLLSTIQKLKLTDRFFILCIYGCTNFIEVVQNIQEVADGILSLDAHHPEHSGFKDYYVGLKPSTQSHTYFLNFWEDLFNCSLGFDSAHAKEHSRRLKKKLSRFRKCSGSETLSVGKGYYPLTPVNSVISAVFAIADVIKGMMVRYCDEEILKRYNETSCYINITEHTEEVTSYLVKNIPKYRDGTIKFQKPPYDTSLVRYDVHHYRKRSSKLVGKWIRDRDDDGVNQNDVESDVGIVPSFDLDDIMVLLDNGSSVSTHAYCSVRCPIGNIEIRDTNKQKTKCCWTCHKCPDHSIAVNGSCHHCKSTERPDHKLTTCTALPRNFISPNGTLSLIFFTLSIVGLSFVIFVTGMFIKHNDTQVVRSSGRDLCYLILFGIFLTFLCPFPFLTKPTPTTCVFRGALPGISFICCYAPLFLRTNRIYRIFFHAKISVARPSLISSQSQLIVSFIIVAMQILLVVVWFVSKMPAPQETVVHNRQYVNLHCKADTSPVLLLLNLALSVIFMISCTVLAFKTRHFPKNYNETKFIGITLYLSCVAWAVFFPGYFMTNPKTEFLTEYLMCGICVAIGYITLFGLFGQKMKMLIVGLPKTVQGLSEPTWYLSDMAQHRKEKNNSRSNVSMLPAQGTVYYYT